MYQGDDRGLASLFRLKGAPRSVTGSGLTMWRLTCKLVPFFPLVCPA